MNYRPGTTQLSPEALQAFARRMRRHIEDLSRQLTELTELQHRQLPLSDTTVAREQALRHEAVCAAYQRQLAELSAKYTKALELTELLASRYGTVDETAMAEIAGAEPESSYGRLGSIARALGG
jgi:hypothetical protein